MIQPKKFIDIRTGEIVTTFDILDINFFEELQEE